MKQNSKLEKMKNFFTKHIKSPLLSSTWEKEGQMILMNKEKLQLELEEKEILKFLISLGTPNLYRSKLWLLCSGAKREINDNPEYYAKLILLSNNVPSLYEKQINLDVLRSNPQKNKDQEYLNKLKRILICYSIRNSSIGYCQGFNFIVCRLLDVLKDEEDAFWVFCQLIEEILPLNYYSELYGVMADRTIIFNFLEKYFPQMVKTLNNEYYKGLIHNYIYQSLISLLINGLNEETSFLIWDYLFLEGNIVLIKSFLAIFGELKNKLINIKDEDMETMNEILNIDTKKIQTDSIELIYCLIIRQYEFDENYIEELRYSLCNYLEESNESNNIEKIQTKIKHKITDIQSEIQKYKNCNKQWPYCRNDSYFENVSQCIKCLVLSEKNNTDIIEEYFFDISSISFRNKKENDFYDIIVERRPHYCSEIIEEIKKERSSKNLVEIINTEINIEQQVYNDFVNQMTNNPQYQQASYQIFDKFNPIPFTSSTEKNNNQNNQNNDIINNINNNENIISTHKNNKENEKENEK